MNFEDQSAVEFLATLDKELALSNEIKIRAVKVTFAELTNIVNFINGQTSEHLGYLWGATRPTVGTDGLKVGFFTQRVYSPPESA